MVQLFARNISSNYDFQKETYEIDKVRWYIFVYASMNSIWYNYDDYVI